MNWTGSQQSLTYSRGGVQVKSCELQRQKPIVMRSISGGYDGSGMAPSKMHTSASAIALMNSPRVTGTTAAKMGADKKKRQPSIEDEPIMV